MNLGTVGPENLSYGKNLNGYDFFYVRGCGFISLASWKEIEYHLK